ncbi:MAG: GTP 3',8-cyclase MoaA, partial [Candidatus Dormibacteria bacterium]
NGPKDRLGRPLTDLRVSVTDRCNFRCRYCMPSEIFGPGFRFLSRAEILSFEEIAEVVEVATELGVTKVRLTGGEPLLRRQLPALVEQLVALPAVRDLAMTTNGALLGRWAQPLAQAGLHRVTVSLDSVDPEVFQQMNGVGVGLDQVLAGIEAAVAAGLGPVKLNAVVRRGLNDDGILDLAAYARDQGHNLRLIEYMDVGESHGWRMEEVVPGRELLATISGRWPLEPVAAARGSEVASRYRYLDGGGELGLITSVTQPFCGSCSRLRLTADGRLHTCLFSSGGHDLRSLLRGGQGHAALRAELERIWVAREDRYSELRAGRTVAGQRLPKPEMSYLGG